MPFSVELVDCKEIVYVTCKYININSSSNNKTGTSWFTTMNNGNNINKTNYFIEHSQFVCENYPTRNYDIVFEMINTIPAVNKSKDKNYISNTFSQIPHLNAIDGNYIIEAHLKQKQKQKRKQPSQIGSQLQPNENESQYTKEEALCQKLLSQWNLSQFWVQFKKEGYDNVEYWKQLMVNNGIELKHSIGMRPGHCIKFIGEYRKYLKSNVILELPQIYKIKYNPNGMKDSKLRIYFRLTENIFENIGRYKGDNIVKILCNIKSTEYKDNNDDDDVNVRSNVESKTENDEHGNDIGEIKKNVEINFNFNCIENVFIKCDEMCYFIDIDCNNLKCGNYNVNCHCIHYYIGNIKNRNKFGIKNIKINSNNSKITKFKSWRSTVNQNNTMYVLYLYQNSCAILRTAYVH